MTHVIARAGLQPGTYTRALPHAEDRLWPEKNCYVDVWIGLAHGLGLDPLAMMSFLIAIDFEGDQWTFYKPQHSELADLYGFDVQELTVWKPLLDHAVEHLGAGKLISTEADAYYLPDTSGTDYQRNHVKTTIVLVEVDTEAQRCAYFHNTGLHWMTGEDFRKVFRVDAPVDPTFLPLFAEVVRLDRVVQHATATLQSMAMLLLRRYFDRRPTHNPITKFGQRFAQELPALQSQGLAHYHAWAFATTRQMGSGFELAALHLAWLANAESGPASNVRSFAPFPGPTLRSQALTEASVALTEISAGAKAFILKAARAVNGKKPLDVTEQFGQWAAAWNRAMAAIAVALQPASLQPETHVVAGP